MSKTPEEMAEEYAELMSFDVRGHQRGFLAGYKAAKAIVEEELQAVAEYPGLGAAQYALKNVLAKMGSK